MVAPKKAKITTLKDLYYRNTPDGTVPPAEWFQRSQSKTKHSTTPNTTTTTNPLYCQPVGSANSPPPPSLRGKPSSIPLLTIAGLPQQDMCAATLQRIYQEFSPIIHHRGYNIQSISEMCCCGDGWTGRGGGGSSSNSRSSSGRSRSTKKPTGRIMHKNVWGYNMTVRGGRGAQPSRIHLRLRQPYDHTQFVSWDFVAGTMAHELAHCVHQNHDAGFYKLMEELLDEHAQYQLYGITTTPTPPMVMPEQGGYKLGSGRTSTTTITGNKNNPTSRLLEELSGGHRLGGIKSTTTTTTTTHSSQQQNPPHPVPLRERIAIAAETRKRQMIHIKHMIEQQSSREPCVIDLCEEEEEDDDDDNNNNDNDYDDNTKTNDHASRNRGKEKHDNVKKQEPTTKRTGNNNNNDQSIVIIDDDTDNEDADDNTAQKKMPSKSIRKISKQRWEKGEEGKEERSNAIPTNSKNTTWSSSSSVSLSQQHWSRRQQHDEMKDMYDNNSTGIIDLTNTILSASASASVSASRANTEENNDDDDDVIVSHVVQASTNNHRRLKRKNDHRHQAPSSSSSSSSSSRSRNSSRSALLHSTGWSCGRCTFQNEDTMVRCSMCNESKDYFDPCKSYSHKSTFR